ncbi:MAG: hypothetical protein KF824_10780 [Fimbriimonadaceae bacterium]|nr:MAG: hypothetical protein KF824_10780 [Fimbriimonadaceae bacterium]
MRVFDRVLVDQILEKFHAQSSLGFSRDHIRSSILDLLEKLNEASLGQLVDQSLAEFKRSHSFGGFWLEMVLANWLLEAKIDGTISCEEMLNPKFPADLILRDNGIVYNFQCKRSENWAGELELARALNKIYLGSKHISPGILYQITPDANASSESWDKVVNAFISDAEFWSDGDSATYCTIEGQKCATFKYLKHRSVDGLCMGIGSSIGGVQVLSIELLRDKLKTSERKGRKTLSGVPNEGLVNVLTVQFESYLIAPEDIFHALYGNEVVVVSTSPDDHSTLVDVKMNWDGLFHVEGLNAWSGILYIPGYHPNQISPAFCIQIPPITMKLKRPLKNLKT